MADLMLEQFDTWHKSEMAKLVAAGEMTAARYMGGLRGSLLCAWEASRDDLVIQSPIAGSELSELREALTVARAFIQHESILRRMCDETGAVTPQFPKRRAVMAKLDEALSLAVKP